MLVGLAAAALGELQARGAGLYFAFAGGGGSALAALAGLPGASTVLIGGRLAYSRRAAARLARFDHGDGFCSAAMAMDLAHAALAAANELDDRRDRPRVGVGVASALATVPARAGRDRAHLAVAGDGKTAGWRLSLDAWPEDRPRQECLTAAAALLAAWRAAGCGPGEPEWPGGLLGALRDDAPDRGYWIARVAKGDLGWARCDLAGVWSADGAVPEAILAGSFDPLHDGHLGLAAAASRHLGRKVELELSLSNVDKRQLDPRTAAVRIAGLIGRAPLLIDSAPTFVEKSTLFPDAVFVVGADTAVRAVDPRYYGNDPQNMRAGLAEIRANGNRFLVAGRLVAGRYLGIGDLDLAPAADLFEGMDESAFRLDVSSSQLRDRPEGGSPARSADRQPDQD